MRPNSTVPCQCWVEPTLVSSPARHCLRSCVSTWWSCILLGCCMECEGRKSSTCGCYLSHPVPRTVHLQRLQLPPQLTNQSETSRSQKHLGPKTSSCPIFDFSSRPATRWCLRGQSSPEGSAQCQVFPNVFFGRHSLLSRTLIF